MLGTSFYSWSQDITSFESLGSHKESMQIIGSQFGYKSSLHVVQTRWLPRKFLSEMSLTVSPILKGVIYLNTSSIDLTYRFYFNAYLSAHITYSHFFNIMNIEGEDMYKHFYQNPLELEHAQKQAYLFGLDWSLLYGKVSILNQVTHFDVYLSSSLGALELFRISKYNPTVSIGGGVVFWLNKYVNARIGFSGSYYKYQIPNAESLTTFLSKAHISFGAVF